MHTVPMSQVNREVYWYRQASPLCDPLHQNGSAEVVIVGGGMTGLMCALALNEAGKDAVILERDFCGAGASGKTSGFITPDSEIELSTLIENHGPEKARRIWEFVKSGVREIREMAEKNAFECDLQIQDSLLLAESGHGWKAVVAEHEARRSLGYESHLYPASGMKAVIGSEAYHGAVRYPQTFGMNSYRFCQELKRLLLARGVRIHERTRVTNVQGDGVVANGMTLKAAHTVVCTDHAVGELGKLSREAYHVQTFLAVSKPLAEEVARAIFPNGNLMAWGTDLIYHYFRITGDNRLLLGGADLLYTYREREALSVERFARKLSAYFHQRFPDVPIELEVLWPGLIGVSKDLVPIVASDKQWPNVHYISAASGLPWAAALGRYGADKILSGRDDFENDFSPSRRWPIGNAVQTLIGTPATFALSHGIVKFL